MRTRSSPVVTGSGDDALPQVSELRPRTHRIAKAVRQQPSNAPPPNEFNRAVYPVAKAPTLRSRVVEKPAASAAADAYPKYTIRHLPPPAAHQSKKDIATTLMINDLFDRNILKHPFLATCGARQQDKIRWIFYLARTLQLNNVFLPPLITTSDQSESVATIFMFAQSSGVETTFPYQLADQLKLATQHKAMLSLLVSSTHSETVYANFLIIDLVNHTYQRCNASRRQGALQDEFDSFLQSPACKHNLFGDKASQFRYSMSPTFGELFTKDNHPCHDQIFFLLSMLVAHLTLAFPDRSLQEIYMNLMYVQGTERVYRVLCHYIGWINQILPAAVNRKAFDVEYMPVSSNGRGFVAATSEAVQRIAQLEECRQETEKYKRLAVQVQRNLHAHASLHPTHVLSDKAQQVLGEIVSTEMAYVNKLTKVANEVIPHLRTMCQVRSDKLEAIFSNWDNIALANANFLRDLMVDPKSLIRVMEAFSQHLRSFSLYGEYYRNYSSAARELGKLTAKDARIQRFLNAIRLADRTVTISDLLIEPVQRLPRYVLLLTELGNKVNISDKGLVLMVLREVSQMTSRLNNEIRA